MTTQGIAVLNAAADPAVLSHALAGHQIYCVPAVTALTEAQRATVAAVVIRSGCSLTADDVAGLPTLRHVVRPGSGTDNIDTASLAARGIPLHRHADANAPAVAEWVLAATIALLRRLPLGHNGLYAGEHLKAHCMGPGLAGRRVAVWGGGPVGRAAYGALGGNADVAFAEWASLDATLPSAPADRLLAWAEVHVLALPLRPSTQHFVNHAFLKHVRPQAVVVCAGRFETIDLHACVEALRDEAIAGLAVDSIDPEHLPTVRDLLRGAPLNLLVTPHIGAQRDDVRAGLDAWVARTLLSALGAGGD